MATMAFKPVEEWTAAGRSLHWLPLQPTLDNFRFIFGSSNSQLIVSIDQTAARPIIASLLSASIGTVIAMFCGTLAAYGVSRFDAGRNLPLALLQLRIFPPMAVMIPVMIMWTFLGMIDTWFGLALIYGIVTLPFSFWLMKTFFDEMPRELEEAALVEGCTRFRVFHRITLPIMMAPFASAALLVFIFNWSDYLIALLLTTKDWRTIPVYMSSLSSSMTGQLYGAKAALGLIAAVPPVVLGLSIQRYLVRGLTFGALKQ
jgi:multiple sugar transport system permease protein